MPEESRPKTMEPDQVVNKDHSDAPPRGPDTCGGFEAELQDKMAREHARLEDFQQE
ncbi:hypothetical protein [Nocardiopsis metallicus]|uniref:Uncharacterized protein n=1 Tax=Nocardiopsis metallicus TaxID=179819 RepID=A0A840WHD6_9ACTN|nr:hypothetical protein [Nocardiopsis metallicus]MBB5489478.1 hypothetical protein [Nocardiopsis metallicus]